MYKAEIWRGSELVALCACDLDALPYGIAPDIHLPDGPYVIRYGTLVVPVRFEAGVWRRVRQRSRRGDSQHF